MRPGDQFRRSGAAAGKLEQRHLIGGGRGVSRWIFRRGGQLLLQAALRIGFAEQQGHGKLWRSRLQRLHKCVIGEKLVGTRADHQLRRDLLRIGGHFQPAMAEKRIDGGSADFDEREKDEVELGDVRQLHQCGVARADAGGGEMPGKIGGLPVEIGIGEAAFAADQRCCIRPTLHLFGENVAQRPVDPIAAVAVSARQIVGPAFKFDCHGLSPGEIRQKDRRRSAWS
jgi:hypothetical protein